MDKRIVIITFGLDGDKIGNAYFETDWSNYLAIEDALNYLRKNTEIKSNCGLRYIESEGGWYFRDEDDGYYTTEELIGLVANIEVAIPNTY